MKWSLDLIGVGTGSIRPELESMRNEVKNDNDLVVQFDTIDDLIMIQREKGWAHCHFEGS